MGSEYISVSIEWPNYKMFYKLRCEKPNADWAVLELNAEIICSCQCAFNWTNAGDSISYRIPLNRRMTKAALEDLFTDRDGYPSREELKIPNWYPTNPQAEILVFGVIPVSYINNVYFIDRDTWSEYEDIIPSDINANVNKDLFYPRRDYKFWQGQEDN